MIPFKYKDIEEEHDILEGINNTPFNSTYGEVNKLIDEAYRHGRYDGNDLKTIPFKYKDIEEAAKKKYPDDVWERVAFKNGALWTIEHLFPEKSREDIFDEMEIPRITLD